MLELNSVAVTEIQHSKQIRIYFSHMRSPGGDRGPGDQELMIWVSSATASKNSLWVSRRTVPRWPWNSRTMPTFWTAGKGGCQAQKGRPPSWGRFPQRASLTLSLENFPYISVNTSSFKKRWTWKSDPSKNGQKQNQEVKRGEEQIMGEQLAASTAHGLVSNCFSLKPVFTEVCKISYYGDQSNPGPTICLVLLSLIIFLSKLQILVLMMDSQFKCYSARTIEELHGFTTLKRHT